MEVDRRSHVLGVSVVVIGRNEAEHLPACFGSISDSSVSPCEVIYVDSGSADASVEIAKRCGARVVIAEGQYPSAAAARNVGLASTHCELVHFVDGDMTMARDWLHAARTALERDDSLACAFGPVLEVGSSLPDRIIGRDWSKRQPGFAQAPGSGGTFRTALLRLVGGYPQDLVAGEETELGRTLRASGYRILCLRTVMGSHELGISSLQAYWARWARGGLTNWQMIHLRKLTGAEWAHLAKPFLITGGAAATALFVVGPRRYRPVGHVGALLWACLLTRLSLRAFRSGEDLPMSVACAVETYLRCPPMSWGFVTAAAAAIIRTRHGLRRASMPGRRRGV